MDTSDFLSHLDSAIVRATQDAELASATRDFYNEEYDGIALARGRCQSALLGELRQRVADRGEKCKS